MDISNELDDFRFGHKVSSKGSLAVVLQLTRLFSQDDLPIDPKDYTTERKGQVAGLGASNLKKILHDHGIDRLLAKEAGRTSRGSMALMLAYSEFINSLEAPVDFEAIEEYWIQCVRGYFASMPFKLASDSSRSISDAIGDLIEQAQRRQRENPGTQYAGSVLQHLVAAKLEFLMSHVDIHGASEADEQTGREGDFIVGDTAIHCTTAPGDLLVRKCASNLEHGLRPIIVTVPSRVTTARNLLEDARILSRSEIWDIQQFMSTNVYEHGQFDAEARRSTLRELIELYNAIIDEYETDPSLRIDYEA